MAAYVRELVITGEVSAGEFLRMEPIAEAVGVSNTPVREGLLLLQSEGFVQLVPRRGFVVAPFTPGDIEDIFWAQARLGGELAARAAKQITPAAIARLEANIEDYERAAETGDTDALAELGHLFHREVNLAAGSRRLALLLGSVVKQLPNQFYVTIEGQVDNSRTEHPLLLDALKRGDARKARSVFEKHIQGGATRLIETLKERGMWAEEQAS
ncbi:GntR family transcriptional regulator [Streptomyces sp. NWU49]|uniref:GntR family transcriptional regulator n=1 Tax=Streptomyces sp. NWU49 TaxID=2201153 RepID=UPI00215A5DFA|nr:GntR family transcriptional regulator [Streptomyces sp. NWU49]